MRLHYQQAQDHPRTCGEQSIICNIIHSKIGSPPHMRGTVNKKNFGERFEGITPAHAGNSLFPRPGGMPSWDHPRTCGEQNALISLYKRSQGSPPHMRGTGKQGEFSKLNVRITPAHAGNSYLQGCRQHKAQDHPRTCGEQRSGNEYKTVPVGSPPHMRGTVLQVQRIKQPQRITPAHAGNRNSTPLISTHFWDHPRTCGEQRV